MSKVCIFPLILNVIYIHVYVCICICKWFSCIGAVATKVNPVEKETPLKKLKNELLSVTSSEEWDEKACFDINENESTVSITVVGASGDLAKKKIFPALFALYYEDCLPKVRFFFFL